MRNFLIRFFLVALVSGTMIAVAEAQTYAPGVPEDLKLKIQADMNLVDGIQGNGATPLFVQIFGETLNGSKLTEFFSTRILNFAMSDCGGGTSVAACASPKHTMWITQNYVTNDIPQIYRISVIFHESRHTEIEHRGWPHVICPMPFLDGDGNDIKGIISGSLMAGQPACDKTDLGAYALQAELLKNVQFSCTNCSEKIKMDAQIFGDDTVKRVIGPTADALKQDVQIKN